MSDIPMLEVLLKRMETHPEEFVDGIEAGKWSRILETYYDCLTQHEKDKISQGTIKARRAMLNQKIMQKLAGEEEPPILERVEVPHHYTHPYNTNPTRPRMQSSSTSSTLTLPSEEELEAMHEAFVKLGLERSREEQEELVKKQYTLEQIKTAMKKASS